MQATKNEINHDESYQTGSEKFRILSKTLRESRYDSMTDKLVQASGYVLSVIEKEDWNRGRAEFYQNNLITIFLDENQIIRYVTLG